MTDLTAYGILGYIALIIAIICIRILAVFVVAGAIATHIGLHGILWWASAIVIFLVINAVISGLSRN
ncbi:hypothetical protein [uncultured Methanobrevibacter sp.]|uniref:hypothetical protein n=1 Tax=uncultured Methanobrevibacter sp. TaxID=253161 RepID=UPI0025DAF4B4|nr:hypothetical protein [uncultured Methanobrevibacter sp.]